MRDRFQYGYDRDSNRLWRDNLVDATFGELYAYDETDWLSPSPYRSVSHPTIFRVTNSGLSR